MTVGAAVAVRQGRVVDEESERVMISLAYSAYCYFCRRHTDHDDNAGCKACGR